MKQIQPEEKLKIESAVLQKFLQHLQKHPEVQNIDLMNLAYFCRNCMAKWYVGAAKEQGLAMSYDEAKEIVYGMTAEEYKANYQTKATEEQLSAFEISKTKATE